MSKIVLPSTWVLLQCHLPPKPDSQKHATQSFPHYLTNWPSWHGLWNKTEKTFFPSWEDYAMSGLKDQLWKRWPELRSLSYSMAAADCCCCEGELVVLSTTTITCAYVLLREAEKQPEGAAERESQFQSKIRCPFPPQL